VAIGSAGLEGIHHKVVKQYGLHPSSIFSTQYRSVTFVGQVISRDVTSSNMWPKTSYHDIVVPEYKRSAFFLTHSNTPPSQFVIHNNHTIDETSCS
jgi:hypothetical protein